MSELKERLDNLRALMQEPEFLEGKGLSNEVNIRIFCYDPSDEMMVRHFIEQIMTDQSMNCHLIEHNLYEVFLSSQKQYLRWKRKKVKNLFETR